MEEHASQRVDVGTRIHPRSMQLLGCHVVERPHEVPGTRQLSRRRHRTSKSEVSDEHPACIWAPPEKDVAGLNVSMNKTGAVHRVKPFCHARNDPHALGRLQAPGSGQLALEILAVDEPHR